MLSADLYTLQLELECKHILSSGRLARFPCDNPDELALVSVVRFFDGTGASVRLREDAAADVEQAIAQLSIEDFFTGAEIADSEGRRLAPQFVGRTGIFTALADATDFPLVERTEREWVVWEGAQRASWAMSARSNARAAELGCETIAHHRRRGFARQVCAAWAHDVLASDRVAFYSYAFSNTASVALAVSLGVEPMFDVATYDRASI